MRPEIGCQLIRRIDLGGSVFVHYIDTKRIDHEDAHVSIGNGPADYIVYMIISKTVANNHQSRVRSQKVLNEPIVAPFEDWVTLDNRSLIAT